MLTNGGWRQEVWLAVRSLVGVFGITTFWAGVFVLYNECTLDLWPDTTLRDVVYVVIGYTGIVLLGTNHYECGVSVEPPCGQLWWQRCLHVCRMTASLWILILCWEGLYELFDFEIESKWVYSIHIILGNFLGLVSDSLEYPINVPQKDVYYKQSMPFHVKAWVWFAGVLSLIGDIVCWVGMDNVLVDYDRPPEEQFVSTKLVYMGVGVLVMYITKTIPNHAHLILPSSRSVFPNDQQSTSQVEPSIVSVKSAAWPSNSTEKCLSWHRIVIAIQRVVGSLAYFTCWAGVESMYYFHGFDSPIDTDKSKLLQLLTAGIGMVCMFAAGSLAFVAFPCGANERVWHGIRNGDSVYTSNVLFTQNN